MNHHPRNHSEPEGKGHRSQRPGHFAHAHLKAYLDGELSTLPLWMVRWHLARCTECREEVKWLQRLGEDMLDLEKSVPRPELRMRIMASLPEVPMNHTPARTPAFATGFGGRVPRFAMAGALLVLAFGGVFALSHIPRSAEPTPTATTLPNPVTSLTSPSSEKNLNRTDIKAATRIETTSPVMPRFGEKDDINMQADRYFVQQGQSRVQQERARQHIVAMSTPRREQTASLPAPPDFRIAPAAVMDKPETLRPRLEALVKTLGGTTRLVDAGKTKPMTVVPSAPTAEVFPSAVKGSTSVLPTYLEGESVLKVQVPKARLAALLDAVKKMGRLERLTATTNPAITHPVQGETPEAAVPPADKTVFPVENGSVTLVLHLPRAK